MAGFNSVIVARTAGGKTPLYVVSLKKPTALFSEISKESTKNAIVNLEHKEGLRTDAFPATVTECIVPNGEFSRQGKQQGGNQSSANMRTLLFLSLQPVQLL